jgi:hypothetical protein
VGSLATRELEVGLVSTSIVCFLLQCGPDRLDDLVNKAIVIWNSPQAPTCLSGA